MISKQEAIEHFPMYKWINVNDLLPQDYLSVLVYCYEGIYLGYIREGKWRICCGAEINPTHWMLPPKPPTYTEIYEQPDKKSVHYFMTQMTQEEFEEFRKTKKLKSYKINTIRKKKKKDKLL